MWNVFFIGVVSFAGITVDVKPLAGPTVQGELIGINPDSVIVQSGGSEQRLDRTGLWELTPTTPAADNTEAPSGAALSDETVVVMLSEMGRTGPLNAALGKDHWPWTSMLLMGPGITGNRVIGRFALGFRGVPIDQATGDELEEGDPMAAASIGAGLLELAGVDPRDHLPNVTPFAAITG